MLAWFQELKLAFQVGIGALLGALLCFSVTTTYYAVWAIPAAKTEAVDAATAKATAKAEQRQKAAQDKIDAIEKQYLQHDANSTARISALEQALASASGGDHPTCRVAIPRGVSDRLDDIGRTAPREDPAVAPSGVP